MSEQNVKLKPKAAIAAPEQNSPKKEEADTYQSGPKVSTVPQWGPGNSGYSPANPKNAQWSQVSKGGIAPGIPDENVIAPLMPMVEIVDKNAKESGKQPYMRGYVPRNKFDKHRLYFENPNVASVEDLKKEFRPIPKFSKIHDQIRDCNYIRNFYANRLGMIHELMEHTKYELENNTNPDYLDARKKFEIFLKEQKIHCEKQLTQTEIAANNEVKPETTT